MESFGPDEQDARTNCHQDHWKRWVNCPAGQIATAAIIHFEAGNTPRSWTGIELRCRSLRTTGTTSIDTSPSVVLNRLADVIDCNATEEKDIRAVAWNIVDDWGNFSKSTEAAIGDDLGKCTIRASSTPKPGRRREPGLHSTTGRGDSRYRAV